MTSGSSWTSTFGGNAINPSQPSYQALTIAANTALVWPLESAGGQPYVAAQIDVTATAGSLQLQMPPGNTGSNGAQSLVTNVGTNAFTVTDQAGNAIATIATTQTWLITLTSNATANGVWRSYQLASTASSATASALAGPGLQAVGPLLQTFWATTSLSANTLITAADRSVLVRWTGAIGSLQLDATANLTEGWFCALTNEGTGALTITCTGSERIDGLGSIVLQPGSSGGVIARAGNFSTVGLLIGALTIPEGGTGATTAGQALTNLGGTSVGIAIFTAPSAASVVALLGLNNFTFTEVTVATNQSLSAGSSNTVFVCTAALTLNLPLSGPLDTTFVFGVYAHAGTVTVQPQASDKINGGSAGASFPLLSGQSALFTTDGSGNWWPLFVSVPAPGGNASVPGTLTVGGTVTIGGALTASGGTLTLDAAVNVTGLLTAEGNAQVNNSLMVGSAPGPSAGITVGLAGGNAILVSQPPSSPPANMYVANVANETSTLGLWEFNTTVVGSITTDGAASFYNTTSDRRLKIDDGLIAGDDAGRIIDKLQPRWFRWKGSPSKESEPGFFAQQAAKVFPWAVRRGAGSGKNLVPWQMDQSKLMPVVVAELQSLRARIAELERKRSG